MEIFYRFWRGDGGSTSCWDWWTSRPTTLSLKRTSTPPSPVYRWVSFKGCVSCFLKLQELTFSKTVETLILSRWEDISRLYLNVFLSVFLSHQLLDCFVIPVLMILSWWVLKTRYRPVHFVAVCICLLGVGAMVGADLLAGRDQGSSKNFSLWVLTQSSSMPQALICLAIYSVMTSSETVKTLWNSVLLMPLYDLYYIHKIDYFWIVNIVILNIFPCFNTRHVQLYNIFTRGWNNCRDNKNKYAWKCIANKTNVRLILDLMS